MLLRVFTRPDPGTTSAWTPGATFFPLAIVDAARPYLSHMAQIKEHVEVFWKRPALAPEAHAQLSAAPAADVLRRLAQKLEGAATLTGDALVAKIEGDFDNVVGLPVARIRDLLLEFERRNPATPKT